MKINVMTDLEGVSGVNGVSDNIGNKIVNLPIALAMLTGEVNALAEGLVKGGAGEVLVADGHGGGNNLDIGQLHPAITLVNIMGILAPISHGLDGSCAAAIQLGAHAMAGVADGYLNHSYNSHAIVSMALNGEPIGEIGIGILKAAYFGVPTILVAGDEAACREARAFVGGRPLTTVATKTGLARYSASNRHPAAVRAELSDAAEQALRELPRYQAMPMPSEFVLDVCYMDCNMADTREKIGAERVDAQTVRHSGQDFFDVYAQFLGWAPGAYLRRHPRPPKQ
ncbi:MAG: M55 family metallopeptidase [Lentisphaerae bacterium]|nr:M55 family metallopeptidase [Lentisphaerota bacterium]